jgi:internalin A
MAQTFRIGSAEPLAEARRRIAEARHSGWKELDLRGLGLTEVPEELCELGQLEVLDLGFNGIGAEGARALSGLVNLTWLDLGSNHIGSEGARALSPLVNLTALNLNNNTIHGDGAQALAGLVNLTSLDLGYNYIRDDGAQALVGLVNLTSLVLNQNEIGEKGAQVLSSLSRLTSLNFEANRIIDEDAQVFSSLVGLTSLNLALNIIGEEGAQALAELINLTSLDLKDNLILAEGAQALAGLANLTSLNLWGNDIGDEGAQALAGLVRLTSLDLTNNGIGTEGTQALSGLVNLTSLCLGSNRRGTWMESVTARTRVKNLSPLLKLTKLEHLDCSGCRLEEAIPALWRMPSLKHVILHEATLPGVPEEVLSPNQQTSCLESLRAHFADISGGESAVTDIKLMFLGNGRVGKTQICRRLREENYDDSEPSTHGVRVTSAPLPLGQDDTMTLKIWDFGGQDIYHGTHALFLKSLAMFLLVWTPESEAMRDHEYGGFTFRNQPLGYWLAYVRHFGGPDSPVLVIQAQCDQPEQEHLNPPVPSEALAAFPFKKVLHYSARENRGRAALEEALADAARWLRGRQGVARIGTGRAKVKARLEELYVAGERLVTQAKFRELCRKAGHVSSPPLLLDYLHNIGTVFYRKGLFGDAIILDQAWALDAVYAVFDRGSKAFKNIERFRGRFRRSDLAEWVWTKHGVEEQELFLSFMQQCGICFTIREGRGDVEAEYIAPDLLPGRDDPEIALELRQKWDERRDAEETLTYDLLPPGLMRSLISKIGEDAGLAAEYWRDGFYFYDEKTGSRALVEQRWTGGWGGEIHVQTQRGQAQVLLEHVLSFIGERHDALGARPCGRSGVARETGAALRKDDERAPSIKPVHEPVAKTEYYVSYAWGDATDDGHDREAVVNRLCEAADKRGIEIIRDRTAMRNGDRISKFMDRIGRGDRVFIVLSDKYLKSPYCMHELFDVWRNCRENADEFIARTRVFVHSSAKIGTVLERAQYVIHWRKTFAEIGALVRQEGLDVLGEKDVANYRRMSRFVHETANMLTMVQDVLSPRTFEDFVKYGFDDPPEAR